MKKFINSLELRWSDLFLFVGFVAYAMFLIFGQLFMKFENPVEVAFPLWAQIICLVAMLGCWSYYLYKEVYLQKGKFNIVIPSIFLALMLINVIVIFVQPQNVVVNTFIRGPADNPNINDPATALISINFVNQFALASELVGTLMFIYIGLFVFPRRFKTVKFIEYLGYGLFALLIVMILYGYIAEHANYPLIVNYFLGKIDDPTFNVNDCGIKSFIIHRNAYGMCMLLGIIFCFINHSMRKKWYYWPLAIFFYLNMIFSICKTGLLIGALIMLVYAYYYLITSFKENPKRNKIWLIGISAVIILAVGIVGLSYITKGKVLGKIYAIILKLTNGGESLNARSIIWDNSFLLLANGNWLIGRGFGTFNIMLHGVNLVTHQDPAIHAHNAYLNLLGEGGVLFLLAYIALLSYCIYQIIKVYPKDKGLTVTISLGILSFFLYSMIEAIHYLVYVFMFPIAILYYLHYQKEENVSPQE